jgi:anti-sigma B factor antagonist
MACTAKVREARDVAIIDLSGRFTLGDAAGVIRNCVRGVVDSGRHNILLNLADVTHMDSAAGLGELIGSYQLVKKMGGDLKLLNAQKGVADVLRITRLDTVFKVFGDEAEAVNSFHQVGSEQSR